MEIKLTQEPSEHWNYGTTGEAARPNPSKPRHSLLYPAWDVFDNELDELGATCADRKRLFEALHTFLLEQVPFTVTTMTATENAIKELRAAGWDSVADDLVDGLSPETVLSRLRSIGEQDSGAAEIVTYLAAQPTPQHRDGAA